jgi:hypothetical protein
MLGSILTTYLLFFIASVALALVMVYLLLFSGVGIIMTLTHYDTKSNVETLTSLISSSSSFSGNFQTIYALPAGNCKVEITSTSLKMTIPAGKLNIGGKEIEISKDSETEMSIIKPNYVEITPFIVSCNANLKQTIVISKVGNNVEFSI